MENARVVPSLTPVVTARGPGAIPILLGGAVTSVASLGFLWLLNRGIPEFNVMGWYAFFVVPIGALLVGCAAGSGYGLGSWFTGSRTTGVLVALVFHLQIAAYAGAQYIEFKDLNLRDQDGSNVGFFTYYDAVTRNLTFSRRRSSPTPATPLGGWGYGFRALEILGFALGGIIVPMILWSYPYCERCARYKRRRSFGYLAASASPAVEDVLAMAQEPDPSRIKSTLAEVAKGSKAASKLPKRFEFLMLRCPSCFEGRFEVKVHEGTGNQLVTEELGSVPMKPDVVRALNN